MRNNRMDDVLRRIEDEERERERSTMWPIYLIGFAVVGGLVAMGYFTWRSDKATGDVVLPAALAHRASPARQDLGLYIRSLQELAQEVERKVKTPGPQNAALIAQYAPRLKQARATGRALEPKVTREETRVLMAANSAEKRIEKFLDGATSALTYKHEDIEIAQRQLDRARKLAMGDEAGAEALEKTPILGMGAQVKSIGTNLAEIKKAQAQIQKIQEQTLKDLDPADRPAPRKP